MNYDTAVTFATNKHEGQVRKYTGEPYINHCLEVADILRTFNARREIVLMAAVLHDTVEDTETTFQEIRQNFGDEVTNLVFFLTNVVEQPQGNRDTRFMLNVNHICGTNDIRSLLIKCADLISNTRTIVERDPGFAKLYLQEKRVLLAAMKKRHKSIVGYPVYHEALRLAGAE